MIWPLTLILVGVMLAKILGRYKRQTTGSRAQIAEAVAGLLKFGQISTQIVDRRRTLFFRLPKHHQDQGIETLSRYRKAHQYSQVNAVVINEIAQFAIKQHNLSTFEMAASSTGSQYKTLETFNHLVRDFCNLTASQRAILFEPILKAIDNTGSVLVPGCGVGGLAFELSKLKCDVTAIEFDPFLYLSAQFIQQSSKSFSVYPWVLEFSHLERAQDQLQPGLVSFEPDPNIKFVYGNFLKHTGCYDNIVTLFFIDTAENLLDYLDQIKRLLKPGGTWINYGPLKWGTAPRIEPSYDELMDILKAQGWKIQDTWQGENRYSGAPTSMWTAGYKIRGWKATMPSKSKGIELK